MKEYIATFFSHFGAVRFRKELQAQGIAATLMPVPRKLSSSCGTCAGFNAEDLPEFDNKEEIEQIVEVCEGENYRQLWTCEE